MRKSPHFIKKVANLTMHNSIVAVKPFNHPKFFRNGLFNTANDPKLRIFITLREYLKKHGYDLVTIDMPQAIHAQALIVLDVPYPWDLVSWFYIFRNIHHSILFHWEPPIINPFNYMKAIMPIFRCIYTSNDMLVDGNKFKKFYYPKTDTGFIRKKIPFAKKKLVTMVASNLSVFLPFQLLARSSELYSTRQKIVAFFDRYAPREFDLYGRGWNKPARFSIRDRLIGFRSYVTYRGACKDQFKVLSRYRFGICLENTDAPGYLCEKMFDCFKAGSVPVYLGAINIADIVPKNCFIDMRDFRTNGDLLAFLRLIDETTYDAYLTNIRQFLRKSETKMRWFEYGFAKLVLGAVRAIDV